VLVSKFRGRGVEGFRVVDSKKISGMFIVVVRYRISDKAAEGILEDI